MKISCIIIDDEPNALSLLEGHIIKIPSLALKGKFFDALEALEFLKKEQVDIIFTDINMPLLTGLELAEVLPGNQRFIFTTAYAEHALNSFSYYVIDYLLKPITFKRFIQSVNKIEAVNPVDARTAGETGQPKAVIFAKSGKQVVKIVFEEILYVKGEKEYVSVQFQNKRLLIYKRMKEMEELLPPYFRRIHLSYIINVNHIQKIEMNHVLIGDVSIPVSEHFRSSFFQFLNEKMI
jgi:two-component system LytT family response regulator